VGPRFPRSGAGGTGLPARTRLGPPGVARARRPPGRPQGHRALGLDRAGPRGGHVPCCSSRRGDASM